MKLGAVLTTVDSVSIAVMGSLEVDKPSELEEMFVVDVCAVPSVEDLYDSSTEVVSSIDAVRVCAVDADEPSTESVSCVDAD